MKMESTAAYDLIEHRTIKDLNSEGYLLKHKKTGAKVVLLENEDENKVFYIGFRTPPKDSTGVAHILEHSVLCGSRKYPVKDPFIQLEKGSLNTFLNAMTYPDKTVYPVASCNDKDFQNLMDVYLDAVFYPNIYKEDGIFKQEGWHYEYDKQSDELLVNGVVYNEMKGAFSSPDDVLSREIMASLYPDNTYHYESGGDPDVIVALTYEDFLQFHQTYYHPSNCYIYLYGNMDMEEKLRYIDEEYLSAFEEISVDSEIKEQKAFSEMARISKEYSISEGESEENNTYLSYNVCVADNLDKHLYVAFQILDYALCQAPGAPIKKALIDRGIGTEIDSSYDNYVKQPFYSIIAKNADKAQTEEFLAVIQEELEKCVKEGLDKNALLAGIQSSEFKYREADFGVSPKGLIYGLQILDSWLYDEKLPFVHIEANQTYADLRNKIEEGYFEELIQKYLLQNPHSSVVVLEPVKELNAQKEKKLKEELRRYLNTLSEIEKGEVIRQEEKLREFQETPDQKEDLERIPLLRREDMKKEPSPILNEEKVIQNNKVLFHDVFTNEIAYIRLMFSLKDISAELLPYVGILKGLLGLTDTEHYGYAQLYNEINQKTGGITVVSNVYQDVTKENVCEAALEVKCKVLYSNIKDAVSLLREILFHTTFEDKKRLYEILAEGKSRMQAQMTGAGHSVAANRAMSYFSAYALINEQLSGIPFYRFVENCEEHFDEQADTILSNMKKLCKILFRKGNLMIDFTGTKEGYEELESTIGEFLAELYEEEPKEEGFVPVPEKKNEGFITAAQIQYVALAGNFKKQGYEYTGALRVLRNMMSCEYLWTQVRVKGGAYGCMCNFGKSGDCYFVSYRDPNLSKTLEVYRKAAEYIRTVELDERELTQYIIGAISDLDTPMTPATKGAYSLSAYMSHISMEMLQKERTQLLTVTKEDIRNLAELVEGFVSQENICVVGNGEKIKGEKEIFMNVENLFK